MKKNRFRYFSVLLSAITCSHLARSGMAHQWEDCPIGRPKAVNEQYLARLKELVNNSPRHYRYSFEITS